MRTSREARQKLAGEIHRHGLRFAGWHAHIVDDGLPIALRVLYLKIGKNEIAMRLRWRRGRCCRRPNPPSLEHQRRLAIGRGAGEIEIQGVQFGHAGMIAPEVIRIAPVARQQRRAHVVSVAVARRRGIDAMRPADTNETRETAAT